MFEKPSKALMIALRDFVCRQEIFVEAREFDDGFIFVRQPKGRSMRFGPRRHFQMFLRRNKRRVRFFTLTCGSEDHERSQVPIDFPEKALLRPAEAAIEYEQCGRDAKSCAGPNRGWCWKCSALIQPRRSCSRTDPGRRVRLSRSDRIGDGRA